MLLQEYFDKIYCVNLAERTDRWQDCLEEFKASNLDGVIRIEATKGIPEGLTHYSSLNLDPKSENFIKKLEGRVGCLISQLEVIKNARKNGFKRILLLEDDVQFVTNVQSKFNDILDQVPLQWGLLYLGGNEKGRPTKISNNIFKVSNMLMAHAVGIDESAYDDLVSLMESMELPNDFCFAHVQKKLPCYAISPFLAWQRAGWSDLELKYRLFDFNDPKPYLLGLESREFSNE